jgi:hypothetical protein
VNAVLALLGGTAAAVFIRPTPRGAWLDETNPVVGSSPELATKVPREGLDES